jgi:hypothetical protein
MKKTIYIYVALAVLVVALLVYTVSTQKGKKNEVTTNTQQTQVDSTTPERMHTVTVVDFTNTSNYTYIKVDESGNDYWIAVNKMEVKKGETLFFSKSMEMKNFHSTELNRTFDSVLFVDGIATSPNSQSGFVHPEVNKEPEIKKRIETLPGGKTVKEIFANQSELSGKIVRIRGEVVKVNSGIMNRNWIHIQDGTSDNGQYDLLVTSDQNAKIGDVLVFEGKVATNKDFGAGYKYPVMIEEAKIISENKKL